jgi:hypothetical protein
MEETGGDQHLRKIEWKPATFREGMFSHRNRYGSSDTLFENNGESCRRKATDYEAFSIRDCQASSLLLQL